MRDGYQRGVLPPQATRRQMDVLAAYVAAGGSVHDAAELVGYQAQHRQAAPRRPTSAVGTDDRAADLFGPRPWLARRPEPGASVIS